MRPAPLVIVALSLASIPAAAQSIFTVAGGRTLDGRPATVVPLSLPRDIALDRDGNLFIADTESHRVRRVDAGTQVSDTIAGNGVAGFSGDGGPAIAAELNRPSAVAVNDSMLFIGDVSNRRLRGVDRSSGIIQTILGDLEAVALTFDRDGTLLIGDRGSHRIRRLNLSTRMLTTVAGSGEVIFSGDGGPATLAGLKFPAGVVVDRLGNIYVSQSGGVERVRKIDAATGIITTIAGFGSSGSSGDGGAATAARLFEPHGLAIGPDDQLYIADSGNDVVRRVDLRTGVIATFAGGGEEGDGSPATRAQLAAPEAIEVDGDGNVLIVERTRHRVRRVDARTALISTIAGTGRTDTGGDGGPATNAFLARPTGIALDSASNLYIADSGLIARIRKIDRATGVIVSIAGGGTRRGDGGPAIEASLGFLSDGEVVVDANGNVFAMEFDRVRRIDATTGVITTYAGGGTQGGSVDGIPATQASLSPAGIAIDADGNLYVANRSPVNRVRRIDAATGLIRTIAGSGDWGNDGDGGAATAAKIRNPGGLTIDGSGNLYVAATEAIRRVHLASGIISSLTLPFGTFVENIAARGAYLYYNSPNDHRLFRMIPPAGAVERVAGTGSPRFSGDAGPATAAGLDSPRIMTFDPDGNLYIADAGNNRVRIVPACVTVAPPSLLSPSDGASGVSTLPRLAWNVVRGAFRYDVLIDTANPPTTIVASDITTTTYAPSNLEPLTRYYWQVVAKGDPYCTPISMASSPIRSFTTAGSCAAPGDIDR